MKQGQLLDAASDAGQRSGGVTQGQVRDTYLKSDA